MKAGESRQYSGLAESGGRERGEGCALTGSVFFFSSRRRHTRWNCDWSSYVCSSDLGRKFDAPGNLEDWWTEADGKAFVERAQCIDDQYSGYTAVDDVKLNGKLTLGENTADNGGLRKIGRASCRERV